MTNTNKPPRITKTTCEACKRPLAVAERGRIAHVHVACRTADNDFARMERAVEAACADMTDEELAQARKYWVGRFFHFTNGKFNRAKTKAQNAKAAKRKPVPASAQAELI